jgi:hypothetical protein
MQSAGLIEARLGYTRARGSIARSLKPVADSTWAPISGQSAKCAQRPRSRAGLKSRALIARLETVRDPSDRDSASPPQRAWPSNAPESPPPPAFQEQNVTHFNFKVVLPSRA